jgi:uncharacterized repeat protein (TIGR03803 family)
MFREFFPAHLNRAFGVTVLAVVMKSSAWSANYKVLYNFNSTNAVPSSGLAIDTAGNAYGVTSLGGQNDNAGSVYELSPTTGYHLLYAFNSTGPSGHYPIGKLALDAQGNLYGTTAEGGNTVQGCPPAGCGVVFELSPPSNGVGLWTETVLYTFCSEENCIDGATPQAGMIFDSVGNLYGTTFVGGAQGVGTVFELSPNPGSWAQTVLHNFGDSPSDGAYPVCGLILDKAGNLYGTTSLGAGTVFELSPTSNGWTENILYTFGTNGNKDGQTPYAGVTMDPAGNLYGTTQNGGTYSCDQEGCGTVFELSPSGSTWTETVIHDFRREHDGRYPDASVVLDTAGNVYGTTSRGGNTGPGCPALGCGTIFRLSPGTNGWAEALFTFPAGGDLGSVPSAPLLIEGKGIYSTTTYGGTSGQGVVFKIMP